MTAHQLRAWRQRRKWTQQQAADSLGISKQHYCKLEQGKSAIRLVVALACNALEEKAPV